MPISNIEEIIEDYRQGKMVILMDDEDRENEGDIMIAADAVTAEHINFMATHGRGLICLTLTAERCEQLKLFPMVQHHSEQWGTAFTVSIEAAKGVTTGISAADRATTIQAAVARNATSTDLVQPGHIFPLKAKQGGVLNRAGHTEAGVDLARLAQREPASVIVEILNEDGTMARRPQLEVFAEKHGIKLGTIADLIEYRNNTETTIERVAQCNMPTEFGDFKMVTYKDTIDNQVHYALQKGEITSEPTQVRVHMQDTLNDVLHATRGVNRTWSVDKAMARIAEQDGILVILGHSHDPEKELQRIKTFEAEDKGQPVQMTKKAHVSRQVGVGSQILSDLGVTKMKLLSSSSKRYHALSGFGLEITEYITQ